MTVAKSGELQILLEKRHISFKMTSLFILSFYRNWNPNHSILFPSTRMEMVFWPKIQSRKMEKFVFLDGSNIWNSRVFLAGQKYSELIFLTNSSLSLFYIFFPLIVLRKSNSYLLLLLFTYDIARNIINFHYLLSYFILINFF